MPVAERRRSKGDQNRARQRELRGSAGSQTQLEAREDTYRDNGAAKWHGGVELSRRNLMGGARAQAALWLALVLGGERHRRGGLLFMAGKQCGAQGKTWRGGGGLSGGSSVSIGDER